MIVKTYARIEDSTVAELVTTADDIITLYHPDLMWVEITPSDGIAEGWVYDGAHFHAPARATEPVTPSLADLELQIRVLASKIAVLSGSH